MDGSVEGRKTRFILDTGAARTHVVAPPGSDLAELHSEASGGVFAAAEHRLTEIDRLSLGELDVRELQVAVSPAGPSALSLLGMDVLGRFRCTFAFREGRLHLDTDEPGTPSHELTRGPRGHAYMGVELDGVAARACWDSGAGITLVDPAFKAAHPDLFSEPRTSLGSDSTGASRQTATFTMTGPTIGGHRFDSHPVAVVSLPAPAHPDEAPIDLILGYPTLAQVDWIMDFPAGRWSLRP